jgi:hypothetical protein
MTLWTGLSFSSGQILTSAQMNTLMNNVRAVRHKDRGTSAPENPSLGVDWIDNSSTPWIWKIYDGTSWTEFAEVDPTVSETRIKNPLTVRREGGNCVGQLQTHSSAAADRSLFLLRRSRGTAASPTTISSGDFIGTVTWQGHNGSTFVGAANMHVRAAQTWTDSVQGSEFSFSTIANGQAAPPVERGKILNIGHLEWKTRISIRMDDTTGNWAEAIYNGETHSSSATLATTFLGRKARGTLASPSAVQSGDLLLRIRAEGHNGSSRTDGFEFQVHAGQNHTGAQAGVRQEIWQVMNNATTRSIVYSIEADGGMWYGDAAGGNQGYGTINAEGLYDDGALLTCYPLEQARTGQVDLELWDSKVPQKRDVIQRVDRDGNITLERVEREKRVNEKARAFVERAEMLLDPDAFSQFWKENGHLPAFPSVNSWSPLSMGDLTQRLWETIECQAVHIAKLNDRLKDLESN